MNYRKEVFRVFLFFFIFFVFNLTATACRMNSDGSCTALWGQGITHQVCSGNTYITYECISSSCEIKSSTPNSNRCIGCGDDGYCNPLCSRAVDPNCAECLASYCVDEKTLRVCSGQRWEGEETCPKYCYDGLCGECITDAHCNGGHCYMGQCHACIPAGQYANEEGQICCVGLSERSDGYCYDLNGVPSTDPSSGTGPTGDAACIAQGGSCIDNCDTQCGGTKPCPSGLCGGGAARKCCKGGSSTGGTTLTTCPSGQFLCQDGGTSYGCFSDQTACHCTVWCAKGGAPGCDCANYPDTSGNNGPAACVPSTSCGPCGSCSFDKYCANQGTCTKSCSDGCGGSWTEPDICSRPSRQGWNCDPIDTRDKSSRCSNIECKQGVCLSQTCEDCDNSLSTCSKCNSDDYFSFEDKSKNLQCCTNWDVPAEFPKYNNKDQTESAKPGGLACCDQDTDCAVKNARCVDTYYFDFTNTDADVDTDFICVDSTVTTRTSLIAEQLLLLAKNKGYKNYTLHCDKPEFALNTVKWKELTLTNVNKVCVLNVRDKLTKRVYIGLSFNDQSNIFSLLSSSDVCSNVPETAANYQTCSINNISYNPRTKSVIFTNGNDAISFQETLDTKFTNWFIDIGEKFGIKNRQRQVQEKTKSYVYGLSPEMDSFIQEKYSDVLTLNDRYEAMYIASIDGQKAIMVSRQPRLKGAEKVEIITMEFDGFDNVCNAQYKPEGTNNYCENQEKISRLFLYNKTFSDKLWVDMTSSVRPR
jgi:hypothetical protein